MVKGFISRRASQRIPFEAEITIQFNMDGKEGVTAQATNLSPEGVRFYLPKGKIKLAPDDTIELVFKLSPKGEVEVKGEVCYFSNAFDGEQKPVVYYGVKFIDLTQETSELIISFCQEQTIDEETDQLAEETIAPAESIADNPVQEVISEAEPNIQSKIDEILISNSEIQSAAAATEVLSEPVSDKVTIPEPLNIDNELQTQSDDNTNPYRTLSQDLIDHLISTLNSQQPASTAKTEMSETKPESKISPTQNDKPENHEINLSSAGTEVETKVETEIKTEVHSETQPKGSDTSNPLEDELSQSLFGTSPSNNLGELNSSSPLDSNKLPSFSFDANENNSLKSDFLTSVDQSLIDMVFGPAPSATPVDNANSQEEAFTDETQNISTTSEPETVTEKSVEPAVVLDNDLEKTLTVSPDINISAPKIEEPVAPLPSMSDINQSNSAQNFSVPTEPKVTQEPKIIQEPVSVKQPEFQPKPEPVFEPKEVKSSYNSTPIEQPKSSFNQPANTSNQSFFGSFNNNSSAVSMDQRMIDQIIQSLTGGNNSKPSPSPSPASTQAKGNETYDNVTVSLELENGKQYNSSLERLYFGGIITRLKSELPKNANTKIKILNNQQVLIEITGVCANCEYIAASAEYQAEFFFKGLNSNHMDTLKSLIIKLQGIRNN